MRKLASIQRVWKVTPIPDADRIETVSVLGWTCVVNKGQFKPLDIGVYFEIDSFLPVRPEFEFLRSSCYKNTNIMGEGFKLRTQKFKGQISQGLILPLSTFPEIDPDTEVGTDVTKLLGVKLWEIEERATTGGTTLGTLPHDVPHTEEIRVQNFPEYTEAFAGLEYYITTKMDGSSHSLSIDENGFHVCGHNYEYKDDGACSFYEFVKKRGYQEKMQKFYDKGAETLTIQGEYCAPGIQRNRLKLKQPEWYVFTVRVNGQRLSLYEMKAICAILEMPMVHVEEVDKDFPSKYPTIEDVLARAEGEYPNGGLKEGIVIRPTHPVYNEKIEGPLSMKAVSNKYLLKSE